MPARNSIRLGALAAALAACAAQAAAQVPPAKPLTLVDASRLSLQNAPVVKLATEDVKAQEGSLRQARGAFDVVVGVRPAFTHVEDDLQNSPFQEPELIKRGVAQGLNRSLHLVADALAEQRKNGRADLPLCPIDGTYGGYVVTLPGTTVPIPLCRPAASSLGTAGYNNVEEGTTDAMSFLYRMPLTFDPMSTFDFQSMLGNIYGIELKNSVLQTREHSFAMLDGLQAAARAVEVRAGLAYTRMGEMPKTYFTDTASLVADITKPMRAGSIVRFTATFDGSGTMYRGKPIDPVFGGSSVRNRFGNRLEAEWVQPLLRGRGKETVEANERAARKNVEASRYVLQQASADQVLATADAYVGLLAAQETLALRRQSLENQRRLLEATIKLVAAGEVPSADVARARARVSEVEASVETARGGVLAAQALLADVMGTPAAEVAMLAGSDRLPTAPIEIDFEALSKGAVGRRADVKASEAFRDSSRIFMAAARANTRMRLDVRFSGGFAQNYFGPIFYSLPDERPEKVSPDAYVRYFSLTGLGRAFGRHWGPIAAVTGVFELPFGNNQRLGNLAQSIAASHQSEIRLADATRSIQNRVPQFAEDVRQARLEWQQRQAAVTGYEATWDATQRLRTAGEITLIDTLLTEQLLTEARLQLVEARRVYASAVARYKRETGTLLAGGDATPGQPDLAGIVSAR
jgi:outer membrane protein TolC